MKTETVLEHATAALMAYCESTGHAEAADVLKNPVTYEKSPFPVIENLCHLIAECRFEMAKKETKPATVTNLKKIAKRQAKTNLGKPWITADGRQVFSDKVTIVILEKPIEAFETDPIKGKPDVDRIINIAREGGEEVRLPSLSALKNYLATKKAEGKKELPLRLAEGCVVNPEKLFELLNIVNAQKAKITHNGTVLYIADDKNNEALICLINPKSCKETGTIEEE